MVKTRKITWSGTSTPRVFANKPRCHIDPTIICHDKTRCVICKVAREHKQTLLDGTIPTKPKRKRRTKGNPSPPLSTPTVTVTDETNKQVMCAYCLYTGKLSEFLISTKKGFHKSQAKCPDCKNGQLIKTLSTNMTPEEYAEFIYSNKGYGVWQKMPFAKWKERLYQIGWAGAFWTKYKELKAQDTTETYEDVVNRQAYEDYVKTHGDEE